MKSIEGNNRPYGLDSMHLVEMEFGNLWKMMNMVYLDIVDRKEEVMEVTLVVWVPIVG